MARQLCMVCYVTLLVKCTLPNVRPLVATPPRTTPTISIKRLSIIIRPVLAVGLQLRLYLLLGLIVICRKRYIRALSIFTSVLILPMVIFLITVGLQLIFAIRFRRMWFPAIEAVNKNLISFKDSTVTNLNALYTITEYNYVTSLSQLDVLNRLYSWRHLHRFPP